MKFFLQVGLLGFFGHSMESHARQVVTTGLLQITLSAFLVNHKQVRTAKVLCGVYDQTLAPAMCLTLPIGLRQTGCI